MILRYGGEEFVIVLPGAGRDDLEQMSERVRRAVAEAETIEADERIPITISIGGSCLPAQNTNTSQDLIVLADAAMYTAKESGRNCWVIA